MRNTLLIASALGGLTAALPQMINIEAALAVPTPTVLGAKPEDLPNKPVAYNQAAATESAAAVVAKEGSNQKRDVNDACALQPVGYVDMSNMGLGPTD